MIIDLTSRRSLYQTALGISGTDVPVQLFAGWLVSVPSDITRQNDPHSQFERESVGRETHVCSQRKLTDDRGTHAEKKGPLQYVDPDRSGEEMQGWGNPGNGLLLDAALNAYVPVDREHNPYLHLKNGRANENELSTSMRKACVTNLKISGE